MRMHDEITTYWDDLRHTLAAMPLPLVSQTAELLLACHRRGGTIFVLGNGGSAATASHFACDLAKGTRAEGVAAFRVFPLTDNMPLVTAWANDVSYERVFAEQLGALVRPGDVAVLISGSGNSPNVLAAARTARSAGALTIAWTGATGGKLARLAEVVVRVPSPSIEQVEDAHLMLAHSVCVALRARLRALGFDSAARPRRRAMPRAISELVATEAAYDDVSAEAAQ
jgi:D-sedoheptulose 7-phosphate isomerase